MRLRAEDAGAISQRSQPIGEAGRRQQRKLEAGFETDLGFSELGYHEGKSSSLLQSQLKAAGFTVESGVAGEPHRIRRNYGHGKPVIALLGEFDALPGLSRVNKPYLSVPP